MLLKIENATPDDKALFWELHALSFKEVIIAQFGGWDDLDQYRYFERKWNIGDFKKIMLADKIIGALIVREYPDHMELTEIQIHPDFRGKGLGSLIISNLINQAKTIKKPVRLYVFLQSRAIELYQRLGFKIINKTEFQYYMEYCI